MTLVHLVAPLESLDDVARAAHGATVFSCANADTIVATGALHGRLPGAIGVWLELSDDYSAQMVARDVATLSWIVEFDHVVVAAPTLVLERAEVVRALLSDDEVTFSNEAATVRGAYNRPSPPSPVTVWSYDGQSLRNGDEVLRAREVSTFEWGVATTFA